MLHGIQMTVHGDIFNLFLQDQSFAMCMLLSDHDDAFNYLFNEYLEKAWRIRDI